MKKREVTCKNKYLLFTSYVNVPPEESDWRSVAFDTIPLAERMQIARGPCWQKDMIFAVTSWTSQ